MSGGSLACGVDANGRLLCTLGIQARSGTSDVGVAVDSRRTRGVFRERAWKNSNNERRGSHMLGISNADTKRADRREAWEQRLSRTRREATSVLHKLGTQEFKSAVAKEYARHGLMRRLWKLREGISLLDRAWRSENERRDDAGQSEFTIAWRMNIIDTYECTDNVSRVWIEERHGTDTDWTTAQKNCISTFIGTKKVTHLGREY